MSRWIAHLPASQSVYFAACEVIYRGLVSLGARREPLGTHFGVLAGYAFASADYISDGVRLLRNINVRPDRIDWADTVFLSPIQAKDFERFRLAEGDLVLSMDGTVNKQGIKIAFLSKDDVPALLLQRVCRFERLSGVSKLFLHHVLHSTDFLDHLDESNRSIAIPHVSPGQLKSFLIPVVGDEIQHPVCEFLNAVRLGIPSRDWPRLPFALTEQGRIVERIESLATKIKVARGLRGEVIEGLEQLCRSMIFNESYASSTMTPMRELVRLREPDVVVRSEEKYQFAGVYCFGRGVFQGQQKSGMEFAYSRLTRLQTGNFVYPKLMAWEGALGVVPSECEGLMVSTEFPVFEVNESRVCPEILDVYFRTPTVWPALASVSTGTNVRRRRLNPSDFLDYHMPLPSKPVQEKLRLVKSRVDSVKKMQAETASELAALLPSILDKAFKGDL